MADTYVEFKNGQSPYISATILNQMQALIKEDIKNQVLESLKLAFPIGSTYITQEDINPETILGFGVWTRVKGQVLVGLDEDDTDFNTIGQTGGEKIHTLSVSEIPAHSHSIGDSGEAVLIGDLDNWQKIGSGSVSVGRASTWDATNSTGGGKAHNNLQPYRVIGYMWLRKA